MSPVLAVVLRVHSKEKHTGGLQAPRCLAAEKRSALGRIGEEGVGCHERVGKVGDGDTARSVGYPATS